MADVKKQIAVAIDIFSNKQKANKMGRAAAEPAVEDDQRDDSPSPKVKKNGV